MIQDVFRKITGIALAAVLALNAVACTSRTVPASTASPAVIAIPEETDTAPMADGEENTPFSLTMLDVGQGGPFLYKRMASICCMTAVGAAHLLMWLPISNSVP